MTSSNNINWARTILALGNWVLGNICRYWVVLLLGDIFFIVTPNTIPIRQHHPHDNHLDVCMLSADDGRESGEGVKCKRYSASS